MTKEFKVAVLGLGMGEAWAKAAYDLPNTELALVYDPAFGVYDRVQTQYYLERNIPLAKSEEEVYASDVDIIIVATPDHLHAEQSVRALMAGKHVACEKPLAPTVEECKKIARAVKESGKYFMTGQVCRYAPGFQTAKMLLDAGRIGELVTVESEYAHDYSVCPGWENWRCSKEIGRQGFLGGGCHALDLLRWLAGDPEEVFAYMNHKFLPDWPNNDSGFAVAKFPNNVIGKIFVSIGVKRPYTMRTVLHGTKGTIVCDNGRGFIELCEADVVAVTDNMKFSQIPVAVRSHNVQDELRDFVAHIAENKKFVTDEYQGMYTVAFAEAAIKSAETGKPEKIQYPAVSDL